jgi:hypothetical protein
LPAARRREAFVSPLFSLVPLTHSSFYLALLGEEYAEGGTVEGLQE